jgi:cation transporter-like permease
MSDTTTIQTDAKSVFQSSTVWGIVIAMIPQVLAIFHVQVAPGFGDAVNQLVSECMSFGGSALALWGRITATKKLVIFPSKS